MRLNDGVILEKHAEPDGFVAMAIITFINEPCMTLLFHCCLVFSAPVMPIGGQVLGVHLQQPERLVEQPVQNGFQGFQFQLPWAPHLSGFNSGGAHVHGCLG